MVVASKDELASLGIHSSITLPIFKFGKVVGILGAYGGEKDFLDEAEISLLEEVAGGISFALENVEKEEERKITGEAIRESNERFLHATRASGEIIYEWRINEDKVWWSEQFFKLMKIEEKTPWQATSSWTDIIHPDDREAVVNNLNEFLEDKGSLWQCQYRVINKEGRTFHWDDRGYVLRDNNGKAYLMIGAITDMTDWKKSEQKLEQQYKELEKTNIELDRFVYSTSHDLRAPLKSMLGLIKLTKADAEPGNRELHKRLDMLNKSVTRLDDFIEEILDYSRNARLEVAKDEINFEELIQEIRANHKFMEEAKGLNLQVKIQQQGKFVSDKRRLKVVLNNLISNAIKYSDVSKEKSFVKIFVECRGENAIATVEDNGIGIAEKDKVKIFEMFYRASTLSSGSGLGLYIVKETIEKLGGAIYLESELNKGTKFTVTIPNLIID
jgi:signal transduction histidine kinase